MSQDSIGFKHHVTASLSIPEACAERQRAIVRARIRALAPVLAALTLLWFVLDVMALPRDMWPAAFTVRAVLALVLLLLGREGGRIPVPMLLGLFLWSQALAFGLMQAQFVPVERTGLAVGYELMPFVIAAQIAVFPLTWVHAVRLGAAPVGALALGMLGPALDDIWRDAWLVALLVGTAAWTTDAQLRLLVSLTTARHDASRDALTGLANRRAAQARLDIERARFERGGTPLSVLMLDLDRFKSVNDRWGHALGDRVLQGVATAIAAELRACDVGSRFGGEEFVVVLPDTPLEDALRAAERIRRRVAALETDTGDDAPLHVTVSIGVAQLQAGEGIDGMLARADAALYRAKSEGRDRCSAAQTVGLEPVAVI